MDSSSKIGLILGKATINRLFKLEIDPFEWLEIVNAALDVCKPYLKYFPRFRPISELLNSQLHDYDNRKTDERIMEFPGGINQKTRYVVVDSLSHTTEGSLRPGFGVRFAKEEELLLTQGGKWLYWEFEYERQIRDGLGFREDHTGIRELALLCRFSLLSKDKFLQLLGRRYESYGISGMILGQRIIWLLHSLASEGVQERARRLRQFEEVERLLDEIGCRIG